MGHEGWVTRRNPRSNLRIGNTFSASWVKLRPMTDTESIKTPLLPRRLASMLYDTLLVLPIIMASVALSMGARAFLLKDTGSDISHAALHPQIVQLIAFSTVIVFFSWFWLRSGQTLGMQAWRIQLVSIDGTAVKLRQAIVRCVGALLSALCLGVGYWWCLFDSEGRYWHDYLSGTKLVLLPNERKGKPEVANTAESAVD